MVRYYYDLPCSTFWQYPKYYIKQLLRNIMYLGHINVDIILIKLTIKIEKSGDVEIQVGNVSWNWFDPNAIKYRDAGNVRYWSIGFGFVTILHVAMLAQTVIFLTISRNLIEY